MPNDNRLQADGAKFAYDLLCEAIQPIWEKNGILELLWDGLKKCK